jgi:hypothetical protein
MWLDDYIDWAADAQPWIVQLIQRRLDLLMQHYLLWSSAETTGLAQEVMTEVINIANDHYFHRDPDYFDQRAQFRTWAQTVALRVMLGRLLRHPVVAPRLGLLAHDQRRLLGMQYLDHLSVGDIAGILRVSLDDVRQRCQGALEAFWQILG